MFEKMRSLSRFENLLLQSRLGKLINRGTAGVFVSVVPRVMLNTITVAPRLVGDKPILSKSVELITTIDHVQTWGKSLTA